MLSKSRIHHHHFQLALALRLIEHLPSFFSDIPRIRDFRFIRHEPSNDNETTMDTLGLKLLVERLDETVLPCLASSEGEHSWEWILC